METFNVLQKLGQGTFGIVYLCERKHNKQKIVVKEIFIDSNNDQLQSARNEVTVLKALQHPNIIQHYDSFGKHGSFYIVMEYARGGTLHEHIKNNQPNYFESDKVMSFFCQILMAIDHIHSKQIVHRDLKTENIFLTGRNNDVIKVGDFGISKCLRGQNDGKTSTVIGTTNYVAPEICNGEAYNMKSDIWSVGCILYELCAGHRMFDGPVAAVVMEIKSGLKRSINLEIYGVEIQQIIDATMQMHPDCRPSASSLMAFPQLVPYIYKIMINLGNIV